MKAKVKQTISVKMSQKEVSMMLHVCECISSISGENLLNNYIDNVSPSHSKKEIEKFCSDIKTMYASVSMFPL